MPMKKPIIIAGITMILLCIAVTVVVLLPADSEPNPVETDAPLTEVLFDLNDANCIEQIAFTHAEGDSISLSKTTSGWQISERSGLPINPAVISPILNRLSQMLALRLITSECTDPSEYGFDSPSLTLTLTVDGVTKTYLFGDENSYYEGYYCMIEGTKAVYLLDLTYVTAFDLEMEDLLLTEPLPALTSIRSITYTDASGAPITVTGSDLLQLSSALATLSIDRMIDYGSEQYEIYGLDLAATLTLTLQNGESLQLRLSEGESEELIYLTIGENEVIYLVTCENMDVLRSFIRK